jgi:hypothetical protein
MFDHAGKIASGSRGSRSSRCRSTYLQVGWPFTTAIVLPGGHPFGCVAAAAAGGGDGGLGAAGGGGGGAAAGR